MKTAKTLLSLFAITLLTALVCAKDHPKHEPPGKAKKEKTETHEAKPVEKSSGSKSAGKITITTQEREVIKSYVKSESARGGKGLPPGLQKKLDRGGQLPPGWQKKVVVGEVMPPEVLKICSPLPKELTVKLPPPPIGTITIAVEGKIVRLMEKTREILDVLDLP